MVISNTFSINIANASGFNMSLLYTEICVISLFLLIYILYRINTGVIELPYKKYLKYIIYSFLGVVIIDAVWKWIEEGILVISKIGLLYFINVVYFICIDLMMYFIFYYYQVSHNNKESFNLRWRSVVIVLFLFHISANIFDYSNHWFYYITENGDYMLGKYYYFQTIIPYSLLIVCIIQSVSMIIKNKSLADEYGKTLFLVILISISLLFGYGSPIGLINLNFPVFSVITTMSLFMYYIRTIELYVRIDPITNLPNRRALVAELQKRMINTRVLFTPLYFIMLSIDDIKQLREINTEVEITVIRRRMVKAMTVLQEDPACKKFNIFNGIFDYNRFGILLTTGKTSDIGSIISKLNKTIDKLRTDENDPVYFEISYGCLRYRESFEIKEYIDRVNSALSANIEKKKKDKLKFKEEEDI